MDKIFFIKFFINLFKKNKYTNMLVELYYKHKEIFDYLFFGALITVVNFISYYISSNTFLIDKVISNVIAFIISVIFAYFVNKIYVFETSFKNLKETVKEIINFISSRLITSIICDIALFVLMINVLNINDVISKIFTQIIIVILNYFIGKFIIFKEKNNKGEVK